jgi:hypothetical protein
MRSTFPYENNDYYDNDSDEDSATSTIDSRQSPSTESLETHYEQQQGKVKAKIRLGSLHSLSLFMYTYVVGSA